MTNHPSDEEVIEAMGTAIWDVSHVLHESTPHLAEALFAAMEVYMSASGDRIAQDEDVEDLIEDLKCAVAEFGDIAAHYDSLVYPPDHDSQGVSVALGQCRRAKEAYEKAVIWQSRRATAEPPPPPQKKRKAAKAEAEAQPTVTEKAPQ